MKLESLTGWGAAASRAFSLRRLCWEITVKKKRISPFEPAAKGEIQILYAHKK
jgi:hypothetical protein